MHGHSEPSSPSDKKNQRARSIATLFLLQCFLATMLSPVAALFCYITTIEYCSHSLENTVCMWPSAVLRRIRVRREGQKAHAHKKIEIGDRMEW